MVEGASGRASGGMERLRQDMNGLALVRVSFCSLAFLPCGAPSLSFAFAFALLLVSDLLLILRVYLIAPHTCHILLINSPVSALSIQYTLFFCFHFFFHSCLR